MTLKPMIVLAASLMAAGCTLNAPATSTQTVAAGAEVETQRWRGPDGCTYNITLVDGVRTGMERVGAGNGNCFK